MRVSKAEFKYLRSLTQKKFRAAEKKFLVEGWRSVKDALSSEFIIELVAVLPQYSADSNYHSILKQARDRRVEVREISEVELRQISDTRHSQGVIALIREKRYEMEDILTSDASCVLVADSVSDPGNLGSILRSCDWFGLDGVFLGKGSVELHNEKVVRSTAGSIFHLPVVSDVSLDVIFTALKNVGFFIAATAADGKIPYTDLVVGRKTALVVGSEARGVSDDVRHFADAIVKIPRLGRAESLNVGVACGIVLAHLRKDAFR